MRFEHFLDLLLIRALRVLRVLDLTLPELSPLGLELDPLVVPGHRTLLVLVVLELLGKTFVQRRQVLLIFWLTLNDFVVL